VASLRPKERTAILYRDSYFLRDVAQQANIENMEALHTIFQHLIRCVGSPVEVSNSRTYRSKGGAEVDLVLEEPDCVRAIEITGRAGGGRTRENLKSSRRMEG
jgi:predicted AAA+ superfamily ATPase